MCKEASLLLAVTGLVALACMLAGCSHPDTHAEASAPPPPSISYIGAWGVRGDGPGQLDQPAGIATDTVGKAYIADAGSRFIHKFDVDGTPLLSFQDEALKQPGSITIDSGGAIYVTDSASASAFVYFPNGDRYRRLRLSTHPNGEDILGIAVGDDGLVHVLDADAGRIFTYTARFQLARAWQPGANVPNTTIRPRAIAVGADGSVYVDDPGGNRIVKFDSDAHFTGEIDAGGTRRLSEEFAVSQTAIFAMDADGRVLHVWSLDGRPLLDTDLATELGQTNRLAPELAVSSRKELLVLDEPGARVLRYRINF
ncbi:MAG: NHL repeat-containing protein [Candidatus Acidiferrales bacterium]